MFQGKAKLIVIALAFVVLLMSSLACNEMDQMSSGYKNHHPTPMAKECSWEKDNDITFILTGSPSVQVAVFANGEVAAVLSVGEAREFPFSALEDYMVSIRTRSGDGAWESRQTLPTIKAGDTIAISSDGINISVK